MTPSPLGPLAASLAWLVKLSALPTLLGGSSPRGRVTTDVDVDASSAASFELSVAVFSVGRGCSAFSPHISQWILCREHQWTLPCQDFLGVVDPLQFSNSAG